MEASLSSMSKKRKYLIETSAVRAAIGPTTDEQSKVFRGIVRDGVLFTSVYIRMEFVRLWICTCIDAALLVNQYQNVREALVILEQSFSARKVKADLSAISEMLAQREVLHDHLAASEELGRIAVAWLRRFDRCFAARIPNKSKCKRGGHSLFIDYDTILDDLQRFYVGFTTPVTDCEVGQFLNLRDARSPCRKLMDSVSDRNANSMKYLAKYAEFGQTITCTECERIGDAVIALEQSKSWQLVHIDKAFNFLCDSRNMPHVPLPSVIALHNQGKTSQQDQSR